MAFFELSIGFERLMKTILVIDHMNKNRLTIPPGLKLKSLGHDLVGLFSACKSLDTARDVKEFLEIKQDSIEDRIIKFLSDFAKTDRYHNLDHLTGKTVPKDPLAEWSKILKKVLESDVSARHIKKITQKTNVISSLIESRSVVVGHDLENRPLDLKTMVLQPTLQDIAAKHVIYHVMVIIKPLKMLLSLVTTMAIQLHDGEMRNKPRVPFMNEFLDFAWFNRPYILRKKRWP
ncbi:MAG: hypothetical protein NTX75_12525 [Proteobacteria bacterium]|nr:hypothetical protein [Pseudomonadota bacterium]